MNDDDLITLIKEPLAGVRMTVPLNQVTRRGRAVRTRRRRHSWRRGPSPRTRMAASRSPSAR
jgi:hypothetical protein